MDSFNRVILHMMDRYGSPGTVGIVSADGAYDPATSSVASSTTEYPVRIIEMDRSLPKSGDSTMQGTVIQAGDSQFYVEPAAGMPTPKANTDYVLFAGKKWRIVTFKDINPAQTGPIVMILYVREW